MIYVIDEKGEKHTTGPFFSLIKKQFPIAWYNVEHSGGSRYINYYGDTVKICWSNDDD